MFSTIFKGNIPNFRSALHSLLQFNCSVVQPEIEPRGLRAAKSLCSDGTASVIITSSPTRFDIPARQNNLKQKRLFASICFGVRCFFHKLKWSWFHIVREGANPRPKHHHLWIWRVDFKWQGSLVRFQKDVWLLQARWIWNYSELRF